MFSERVQVILVEDKKFRILGCDTLMEEITGNV
jgi:hypothetical protein